MRHQVCEVGQVLEHVARQPVDLVVRQEQTPDGTQSLLQQSFPQKRQLVIAQIDHLYSHRHVLNIL